MTILPAIFDSHEPAGLKLYLGVVPVEAVDLYPVIQSVAITVSRREPGVATLTLSAMRETDGSWPVLDGGWFTRWNPIRLVADFGAYQEDVLWGYVMKVTPEFPADRGAAKVTVEVQDETIALDRQTVTREWNTEDMAAPLGDLSILTTIATTYRLFVSPDSGTGQSPPSLTQDATDFRFLSERAEKCGYELRVMFGEVYFGPPRLDGEPQPTILVYAGPDTTARDFKVEEEAALPAEATMGASDPSAPGGGTTVTVSPRLPVLGRDPAWTEGADGLPPFSWAIKSEGDTPPDAAEMLAQAKVDAASLSIRAEALVDSTLYGHVVLPGRTIRVDGIGQRYGGRFYVDVIEHVFDPTGYTQRLTLLKNGVNEG